MANIPSRKILLALNSSEELQALKKSLSAFAIETAQNGQDCLQKLSSLDPDLLIIDLMLPEMHGIEIIKRIRSQHKTTGIILVADQPMIQAYDAAVGLGVNEFLVRPYSKEKIKTLCEYFFAGNLKLSPLSIEEHHDEGGHCYIPKIHNPDHYLKFWGTRGSSAVAGADYVRYGGNSS